MANQSVAPDQINVSVRIRVLDDTDGTPKTDLVAAAAGHEIWYQRGYNTAAVTDAGSAADHSAITDAHTDWEFIHIKNGWYRVDFPDAAFAEGVGSVLCGMDATGFTGISQTVIIDTLIKFQGQVAAATATTTTFPSGTTPKKGDSIYVASGTGERQTRLITSVAGEVATHLAWDVNISDTTSTVILIPGDETLADGGINVDTTVSSRSTVTVAQVGSEVDDSLVAYDPPTRTEATADKTAILDRLPNALSTAGNIKADIEEVNETAVTGDGQSGTEWGP